MLKSVKMSIKELNDLIKGQKVLVLCDQNTSLRESLIKCVQEKIESKAVVGDFKTKGKFGSPKKK